MQNYPDDEFFHIKVSENLYLKNAAPGYGYCARDYKGSPIKVATTPTKSPTSLHLLCIASALPSHERFHYESNVRKSLLLSVDYCGKK
jgi:hypothetical protein